MATSQVKRERWDWRGVGTGERAQSRDYAYVTKSGGGMRVDFGSGEGGAENRGRGAVKISSSSPT